MASKYLDFQLVRDTGKTEVYSVDSRSSGGRLAVIKWYGPWRQYVIEPEAGTVWNSTCLYDVKAFLEGLMGARRTAKEAQRPA